SCGRRFQGRPTRDLIGRRGAPLIAISCTTCRSRGRTGASAISARRAVVRLALGVPPFAAPVAEPEVGTSRPASGIGWWARAMARAVGALLGAFAAVRWLH